MLDRRGIVNRTSIIGFSSAYQGMNPHGIDRRNFISGLPMVSPNFGCNRKYASAVLFRGGWR
jgi:hypothetical protein